MRTWRCVLCTNQDMLISSCKSCEQGYVVGIKECLEKTDEAGQLDAVTLKKLKVSQ